jgi:hypothetical protein
MISLLAPDRRGIGLPLGVRAVRRTGERMRLAAGGRGFESEDLFERFWARDLVALGVVDAERADEAQDVGVCDELESAILGESWKSRIR